MLIRNGRSGAIGNTPLLRLGKLSAETGCGTLGKADFLNHGSSVKEHCALCLKLLFNPDWLNEKGLSPDLPFTAGEA